MMLDDIIISLLDDVKNDDIKNPSPSLHTRGAYFCRDFFTPSPATMMEKIWGDFSPKAIPKLGCLYFMALPQ